ncbi:hypothetical protein ABHA96_03820 [Ligilactobacillus ruminis]|uniref:hypothetical protein n=1 Tax=Ligilactobacillus ruminis TaxID=1623 RepID=UPI00325EC90E
MDAFASPAQLVPGKKYFTHKLGLDFRKKAITDKMGKNSRLSVKIQAFRTLFYGQMLQKAACVRKSSA